VNRRRFGIQFIAVLALLIIGSFGHIQATPKPQRASEERGIYTAVLASLFRQNVPSALVVETRPLLLRNPSAADWQWLGPDTSTLRSKVESEALRAATSTAFTPELFPPGTTLVSREDIAELFRTAPPGQTTEDRWLPFRTRFHVQTYQGFSRPVVTDDGLNALVWFSHACGSLCGEAGYAWVQRSSTTAEWVVVKRLPKIVS
jgi:hypothetical protein